MGAGFEEGHGQLVVQPRRRGDHGGVDQAEERGRIGQGLRVALCGEAVAGGRRRVDDRGQLDVRQAEDVLGVISAEAAGPDDGDV